jgi:prepilin-type N-terminal cleavage/methylation domain-containing protein
MLKRKTIKPSQSGFTLIELLVVIAILAGLPLSGPCKAKEMRRASIHGSLMILREP